MNPLNADGALPRRAALTPTGSAPRSVAAARAHAQDLAALFAAQMQQSMLESLAGLSADGEAGEAGGTDESGGLGSLGDATSGADGLGSSSSLTQAGAGIEASLAQRLLQAFAVAEGGGFAAPGAIGSVATGSVAPAGAARSVAGSRDARANAAVVADVARSHGVDPVAAVAMMLVESGGDAGAVGDNGTSFGLFQLHEGGMLTSAGLTAQQAFDPSTNANVSLRSLAREWSRGPGRTPGQIAAASQRPANPTEYASRVDATMARARQLLEPSIT